MYRKKNILTNKLSREVSLILFSAIYLVYTLFPLKEWFRFSNYDKNPLPTVNMFQDSIYYLGQLREILKGNYQVGNPILYETSTDGYSFGNSSLFYVWGTIGRIFELNLIQTYIFMISFNSIILFISINTFYQLFLKSKLTYFITLLVCVYLIGPLGRPSPTEQLLPILVLSIVIILKYSKTMQKVNIKVFYHTIYILLNIVLTTGNQFYSVFLFMVSLLYTFIINKKSIYFFIITSFCNVLFFLWTKFSYNAQDFLISERLGAHNSRLPGALNISLPILIILLGSLLFYSSKLLGKYNVPKIFLSKYKIFLVLILALLIAVNSQIFTNISAEMESHFKYLWLLFIGLFPILLYKFFRVDFFKLSKILRKLNVLSQLAASVILILFSQQFGNFELSKSKTSKLITSINHDKGIKSILIKNDPHLGNFSEQIITLTSAYLYWDPAAKFSSINNEEILSRFSCTHTKKFSYKELIQSEIIKPSRSEINANIKLNRINRLLDSIGFSRGQISNSKASRTDYEMYLLKYNDCLAGKYNYKLDRIIYPGLIMKDR